MTGKTHKVSKAKKIKSFDLKFDITDHSLDYPNLASQKKLRQLYKDIKHDGIESIRYDWRWRKINPQMGIFNQKQISLYVKAAKIMKDVGLAEPTIILSDPPDWAKIIYRYDKDLFFEAYKDFITAIKNSLKEEKSLKISRVQVFNELNNPFCSPVKIEDIPKLCQITREVFSDYNPNIKIMLNLLLGNLTEFQGKIISFLTSHLTFRDFPLQKSIWEYLFELKKQSLNFDIIAIDYYPGVWHLPLSEAQWTIKDSIKELLRFKDPTKPFIYAMLNQMDLLKRVLEEIASWNVEYEIGEMGFPTKRFLWGDEARQRYAYKVFARGMKGILSDFHLRGVKLLTRIGFYEAVDEPPRNFWDKAIQFLTPYPEFNWGMRSLNGEKKLILREWLHTKGKYPSELKKIIDFLKSPVFENNVER